MFKKKSFYLFFLLSIIFVLSCCNNRDPLVFCESQECSYSEATLGVVSITERIGSGAEYFLLTGKGLKKIDLPKNNGVLFAYDFRKHVAATKKTGTDSFAITLFDLKAHTKLSSAVFPETVSTIFSACFLEDSSLAVLLLEEGEDLSRKYFVSISAGTDLSNWRSFLIKEESRDAVFERILLLGEAYERPFSIQCIKDGLLINTLTSFSDMLQANIYNFNIDSGTLIYEAGYHPLNVKGGTVSIGYNENSKAGYVHQGRSFIMVKGTDFPIKTTFDEQGDVFFSPSIEESSLLMYFIPGLKTGNAAKARIIDVK